jgi:hypothetical protein
MKEESVEFGLAAGDVEARDLYLERHKVNGTRDLINEGYKESAAGVYEAEQTPPGCLH